MHTDRSFWRNVAIIGVVHAIVLGGLARWSSQATKAIPPTIVWMDGGAAALAASAATSVKPIAVTPPPEPEQPPPDASREPEALTPVKSDIELATPTPNPTPTATPSPTATPKPATTPKPAASASPKASPKPSPRPRATPKPASSPKKTLIAKADPSPSKKAADEEPREAPPTDNAAQQGDASTPATNASSGAAGGKGSGPGGSSQVVSYGRMLHDRFYKAWEQPMSVVAAGTKMSALVRIRIEKDGRVTGFNIIRPSGNVLVDESVAAVARRVTQVDPLPSALGGPHYEVNMNFELTLAE